ncbi:jg8358 [Pararge aegeria aegeria]|uniref:Jg8358 protein n=1 Tax=Pararge aegeria aegeria TaxID=348720 RepID=A0A8S4SEH7_9NEOP|nr:jg8358 [Pararge aegeria aegeria]
MLGFRSTMCNRQHTQACLNTSLSIRQEIQRFESVHPSIYALYDLVELVPDPLLAQQIRDHVVAIEVVSIDKDRKALLNPISRLKKRKKKNLENPKVHDSLIK